MKGVIDMSKIKTIRKWWKKKKGTAITWGDYARFCKWSFGIVGIIYAIIFIYYLIQNRKYKKSLEKDD